MVKTDNLTRIQLKFNYGSEGRDVAPGADRHLDITFGLQVVERYSLFPYFLEKHLAIPTSPFFIY